MGVYDGFWLVLNFWGPKNHENFELFSDFCLYLENMRLTKNFILTKMKEHKISRRITHFKVKINSTIRPQSIAKFWQFLPTWRKRKLCSLGGTRNHSSNFDADPHNSCQLEKFHLNWTTVIRAAMRSQKTSVIRFLRLWGANFYR